jgi:hypothetical protein
MRIVYTYTLHTHARCIHYAHCIHMHTVYTYMLHTLTSCIHVHAAYIMHTAYTCTLHTHAHCIHIHAASLHILCTLCTSCTGERVPPAAKPTSTGGPQRVQWNVLSAPHSFGGARVGKEQDKAAWSTRAKYYRCEY